MPEYCVTGGTGFIAANLVKSLLDKGHNVRTTVRDPENEEKVGFLWKMNGAKERLKIMKADLMEEGSFDEATSGVDGVFHTASPVLVPYDENVQANLINPCIKGTINVLNSCIKAGVKRVVLTSSCSAIRYRDDAQQISPLNESHWSDPEYCRRQNVAEFLHETTLLIPSIQYNDCIMTMKGLLFAQLWYAYAKTEAEKAAWKIAEENGLDLVALNASFVVGPLIMPQPTSTLLVVLSIIKGAIGEYQNQAIGFVHIDDVVDAHILAMENTKASGRLICSGSVAHWSQIIDMLKAKYPAYPYEDKCGSQKGDDQPHSMDTSKITQLGFPGFKTIPEMFDDCIRSFQEKGLL